MDRVRVGLIFRAVRREQGLRQVDLAERAGVCQQTVSNLERGRFGGLSVDAYCRLAECLGADLNLAPSWRGPKLARLLDRRHASMQNSIVGMLLSLGWQVQTEVTFNRYGERGSIDVLAWRADARAVLVVEVKTELVSIEETLRILNMKSRLMPGMVAQVVAWKPEVVGTVLVMPAVTALRDAVSRHVATLSVALPDRTVGVRRWLAEPTGRLRGIWFLRDTTQGRVMDRRANPDRIRRRATDLAAPPNPRRSNRPSDGASQSRREAPRGDELAADRGSLAARPRDRRT